MSRRAVQPIERLMAKVVVDEATGCRTCIRDNARERMRARRAA